MDNLRDIDKLSFEKFILLEDIQARELTKRIEKILGGKEVKKELERGDRELCGVYLEIKATRDNPRPSGKQIRLWHRCDYLFICVKDNRPMLFALPKVDTELWAVKKNSLTHGVKGSPLTLEEIVSQKKLMSICVNCKDLPEWISKYYIDDCGVLLKPLSDITEEEREMLVQKIILRISGISPTLEEIKEGMKVSNLFETPDMFD